MTEPLPIDASDWNDDDSNIGVAAPRSSGFDSLLDFARNRLIALVEDARDSLVGQVRGLKSLADAFSQTLGNALGDTAHPVSHMIGQATGTIDTIADALAEKSVEELVEDGRELVRAKPVVAVGLAIAVGFLIGRIAKASQDS